MDLKDTYKKTYKMQAQGEAGMTITVAIPPEFIQRKAEVANMTVPEFIKNFRAIAHFNGFDGVHYTFEKIPSNGGL